MTFQFATSLTRAEITHALEVGVPPYLLREPEPDADQRAADLIDRLFSGARTTRRATPLTWSERLIDQHAPGCVYFIQAGAGPIKIGYTTQVVRRFDGLQVATHERLHLLAIVPGPRELERALHGQFRHRRLRGEWFSAERDLLDWAACYTIAIRN